MTLQWMIGELECKLVVLQPAARPECTPPEHVCKSGMLCQVMQTRVNIASSFGVAVASARKKCSGAHRGNLTAPISCHAQQNNWSAQVRVVRSSVLRRHVRQEGKAPYCAKGMRDNPLDLHARQQRCFVNSPLAQALNSSTCRWSSSIRVKLEPGWMSIHADAAQVQS